MDLDIMCAMLFGIVCGQILQAFMLAGIRDALADLAWYAGLRASHNNALEVKIYNNAYNIIKGERAGRVEVDDTTEF